MNGDAFPALVELWLKGAALLAATWLLTRLPWMNGRRPWRAAFFGLAILTVLSALPSLWEWRLPGRPVAVVAAVREAWRTSQPEQSVIQTARENPQPASETLPESPPGVSWTAIAVRLWLVGGLLVASWVTLGHAIARRWSRNAEPMTDASWLRTLAVEAASLSVKAVPRLAIHPAVPGPCTVGLRQPAILLPVGALSWDDETRRAVLRHELAHVAARDGWSALLRGALLAIHWPNPLAWLAMTRARREDELTADRTVLAGGADPTGYAAILLALAQKQPPPLLFGAALPMARLTAMEGRFQSILAAPRKERPAWWRHGVRAFTLAAVVAAGCSQFRKPVGSYDLAPGFERKSVDFAQLDELLRAPSFKGRLVNVRCRVTDATGHSLPVDYGARKPNDELVPKGSFDLSVRSPKGQLMKLESLREFVYPDGFDFPEMKGFRTPRTSPAGVGYFPVTPTTPKSFQTRQTGWSLDLNWTESRGAFLMLEGTFHETAFDGFIQCPGEPFSPIVTGATTAFGGATDVILSENRASQPTFTTRETPFQVAALPGKTYRLPLNLRQRGAVLEITVDRANETR